MRRRIDLTDLLSAAEEIEQVGVEPPNLGGVLSPESAGVAKFVAEVLRVYHGQFWLFLKLTAPAVVLGYIAVFLGSPGGTRYYSIFREALSFSHISSCLRVSS